MKWIWSGLIKTHKDNSPHLRLLELRNDLLKLLNDYQPEVLAIERLFFFKNVSSAMAVAQARGVILSAAAEYKSDIKIAEYSPGTVKKTVTGNGQATKPWIIAAVEKKLGIKISDDNESDALAIAMTYIKSLKVDRNVISQPA